MTLRKHGDFGLDVSTSTHITAETMKHLIKFYMVDEMQNAPSFKRFNKWLRDSLVETGRSFIDYHVRDNYTESLSTKREQARNDEAETYYRKWYR